VPVACGVGRWGDIDVSTVDLFVDPAAQRVGDGSEELPYRNLARALRELEGHGTIGLAAGRFIGNINLYDAVDVHLQGRCSALSILVGVEHPYLPEPVIRMRSEGGQLTVSDVGITSAHGVGVTATRGAVSLEDVEVFEVEQFGVISYDALAPLRLDRVWIHDLGDAGFDGTGAWGIVAVASGVVSGKDVLVERSVWFGAASSGGQIDLEDTVIREVLGPENSGSTALDAYNGGELSCTRCWVGGMFGSAVVARDSSHIVLDDVVVMDLASGDASDEIPVGLMAKTGSTIEARNLTIQGVEGDALVATYDSTISLSQSTIEDVHGPAWADAGYVAAAYAGLDSALDLHEVDIRDVEGWGVLVTGAGTTATLADVQLRDVGVDADALESDQSDVLRLPGGGIAAGQGATLDGTALDLDHVFGVGVAASAGGALVVRDLTVSTIVPTLPTDVDGVFAGPALMATESGQVMLTDASITDAAVTAMAALGGDIVLDQVHVADTRPAVGEELALDVLAAGGGTISGGGLTLESARAHGLEALGAGSAIDLADVLLADSVGFGAVALDGAALSLDGAEVRQRGAIGVAANGTGSALSLVDTVVTGTRDGSLARYAVGIGALAGATATLERVQSVSDDGVGLLVHEASATCSECTVTDAEVVGVYVADGSLALRDSTVLDTRVDEWLGGP